MKPDDFYTPEQRAEHERGLKRATEAHRRFVASVPSRRGGESEKNSRS